jgi:hypothetical protein
MNLSPTLKFLEMISSVLSNVSSQASMIFFSGSSETTPSYTKQVIPKTSNEAPLLILL